GNESIQIILTIFKFLFPISNTMTQLRIANTFARIRRIGIFLLGIMMAYNVQGQINLAYYLPDTDNLNPEITTPEEFLGFQVGEWHVTHTQQMYYMKQLAQDSDRIQYHTMGKSHEDRPLVNPYISHPDNMPY